MLRGESNVRYSLDIIYTAILNSLCEGATGVNSDWFVCNNLNSIIDTMFLLENILYCSERNLSATHIVSFVAFFFLATELVSKDYKNSIQRL